MSYGGVYGGWLGIKIGVDKILVWMRKKLTNKYFVST